MTLASTIEGRSAPLFLAMDRGYFAAENLAVDVVPGTGSANTVTRIASRSFPIGVGDVASLIKFNAENPGTRVKAIYNFYMAEVSIVTLRKNGITKPQDLAGKTIGAPTGDTAYRMFPAFSAATNVASSDVKWQHMALPVREVMLLQGKVDAVTATATTAYFALLSAGTKESDIVIMRYADYGVNIVGNGLITSEAFLKEQPETVRKIVRAINHGWLDAIADPEAGVDAVLKREPLLKRDIELAKLKTAITGFTGHADAIKSGVGSYSDDTLNFSIGVISKAENLTAKIEPGDIADLSFLPPITDRTVPKR